MKKDALCGLTKEEINQYFLPLLPKNKRGFASKVDPLVLFSCFQHKLKSGCQWHMLFPDIEGVVYPCSAELVYYFFNKWSKAGVFEHAFQRLLRDRAPELPVTQLNVDGTHTSAKKGGPTSPTKAEKRRVPATWSMLRTSGECRFSWAT